MVTSRRGRLRWRGDDLVATLLLTGLAAAVAGLHSTGWLRLLLVAPLILVLPGHALRRSLGLQPRAGTSLARPAAWTFDLGLSLCTVVLVGLLLDRFPAGLSRDSWRVGLLTATTLFSAAAMVRDLREGRGAGTAPSPHADAADSTVGRRTWSAGGAGLLRRLPAAVCWLLAAAVAVGAITYSVADARRADARTTFTQMSLTRSPQRVTIDVRSYERTRTLYSVIIFRGAALQGGEPAFTLAPGQHKQLSFFYYRTARPEKISFVLHRSPNPGTYRELHYWTNSPVPAR